MWFLRRLFGIEARNDWAYINVLEQKVYDLVMKNGVTESELQDVKSQLAKITDRYK